MKNRNSRRGNTQNVIKNKVILNLIQDLQRLSLRLLVPLINNLRGRSHIKYGMTPLFDNGKCVEGAEQRPLSIRLCNNKAFTLIELLVVVLIIGILAAVALPQYQKAVVKSRFAILQVGVTALVESIQRYYLEYGELPPQGDLSNVDISNLSGCEPAESGDLICSGTYYHWENTPWFGRYVEGYSIKGGNLNNTIIGYRIELSKTATLRDRICFSDSTRSVCKSMGTPYPANTTMFKLP